MDDGHFAALAAWLSDAGLSGQDEATMVNEFCTRLVADGFAISARPSVHRYAASGLWRQGLLLAGGQRCDGRYRIQDPHRRRGTDTLAT